MAYIMCLTRRFKESVSAQDCDSVPEDVSRFAFFPIEHSETTSTNILYAPFCLQLLVHEILSFKESRYTLLCILCKCFELKFTDWNITVSITVRKRYLDKIRYKVGNCSRWKFFTNLFISSL